MNHIGLFEGIGGFSLAARWMGWKTIAWSEWNPFCQSVLKHHFPNATPHGDITKTDFSIYRGQCDIVTGGFPCQPYSQAGKRLGKADDRHLFPEMLRAIGEIQPRWVVGENVSGLVNWSGGLVFEEVQTDLEAKGYEVAPFLLPACGKDAPHRRERIWFIAHRNSVRQFNGFSEHDKQPSERGEYAQRNIEQMGGNASHPCNKRLQGCKINGSIRGIRSERNKQLAGLLQPNWEKFPTVSPLCQRDDGLSDRLSGISFPKWRNEGIKALGNAVVPQVVYEIFKAIQEYELL